MSQISKSEGDNNEIERDNNGADGLWEEEFVWEEEEEPCAFSASDRVFAIPRIRRQSIQSVLRSSESIHNYECPDVVRMKDFLSSRHLGNRTTHRSESEAFRRQRNPSAARNILRVARRLKNGMVSFWKTLPISRRKSR